MAIVEVGTRSIATLTAAGGNQPVNNTTHTVPSGTDFLLNLQAWEGNESPNPVNPSVWDATGTAVDLTLIGDTGSTGSNSDVRVLAYGLVSPQALTGVTARSAPSGSGSPAVSVWINFTGTSTASVAAATNLIDSVTNTAAGATSVLSSGGTSGNGLICWGAAQGNAMSPSSVDNSFVEVLDTVTAATTSDLSYQLSTLLGGAPSAATITWGGSNENAALLIELVASGSSGINILSRRRM